jgi:hypothetical protein
MNNLHELQSCNSLYMVQFIVVQLQLSQNNSFSTTMQFIITTPMMSLIVIHALKSSMWHYEVFWT